MLRAGLTEAFVTGMRKNERQAEPDGYAGKADGRPLIEVIATFFFLRLVPQC